MKIREAYLRLASFDRLLPFKFVLPLYWAIAPIYDKGAKWLTPEYDRAIAQLLQAIDVAEEDVFLDVACGTGKVLMRANGKALMRTSGSGWCLGIDLSADMLRQLRRKTVLPAIRCDARQLSLQSNTFTAAASSFMLLHLTESQRHAVFAEVWRVLRPGGRFGCLTADARLGQAYGTDSAWRRWFTQMGFESVEIHSVLGDYRVIIGRKPHES